MDKQAIINKIIENESLRPLDRTTRLFRYPIKTLPYYILAAISHIRPFKKTFKTVFNRTMSGYMPEVNTFYYYGYCEANLTSFLLRFLKRDMVFVDIGAHIGFYSILASDLVGNGGQIYSFEPTPWTYEILKENIRTYNNIKIYNVGVSDKPEEIPFADYGPGYGAYNSANRNGTMLRWRPDNIMVKVIKLDDFLRVGTRKPEFIKIDAEGFEYEILCGMKETLSAIRPIITLEMAGDERWLENCSKSSEILYNSDYQSFEITIDGYIRRMNVKPPYTYTNILFVPNEKLDLVKDLIR